MPDVMYQYIEKRRAVGQVANYRFSRGAYAGVSSAPDINIQRLNLMLRDTGVIMASDRVVDIENKPIEEILASFTSSEAVENERIWEAKFQATPTDKLNRLAEKIRVDIREGKVSPLDFTNR